MSGNIFRTKRFAQLVRQHIIHNRQMFLLSAVAYVGVILIVLSITQIGNGLVPHDLGIFQGFLIAFVSVFGILYVGHSFPAFRSKERAMNYLMLPASHFEKFLLEFVLKICLLIVMLPLLYWLTFHLQGYFFSIFTAEPFQAVGIHYLTKLDAPGEVYPTEVKWMIGSAIMLALTLGFTGSTIFIRQPLVKTLFSVAIIIMFFTAYSYVVLVELGVSNYLNPGNMLLLPNDDVEVLLSFTGASVFSSLVMLFVAYRKLKEKEV